MRLVTLGGAALQLAPPGTERLETTRTLDVYVTGPECNAAVAASRLGADAAWLSRLPDSPMGRRVAAELRGRDLEVIADHVDGRQGVTFFERGSSPRQSARFDDLEATTTASLSMESLPVDALEGADTAYVTAATPTGSAGLAVATAKFLKTATNDGTTTAFGLFDADSWAERKAAVDTLEELFPAVDTLIADVDAVETILDYDGEPTQITHTLASDHGFETVALRGRQVATVYHETTVHEAEHPDVDAVDDTGAADAFAGAFLAGLDDSARTSLRSGVAAEALVRTTPGPLSAFTAEEIDRLTEEL